MASVRDSIRRVISNRHNHPIIPIKFSILKGFFIFIIIEIGISPFACADYKQQANNKYFMGIHMELPADAVIKRDDKNDTITLLKGENLSADLESDENFKKLQSANRYSEIALAFLSAYHLLFLLNAPCDELSVKSVQTDNLGFTHIKIQQFYKSIPVWASEINFHLDQHNHVYLIQGGYMPTPVNVNTQPVLTEEGVKKVVAGILGKDGREVLAGQSEIIIFADTDTAPCLSYRIKVAYGMAEGGEFIIDATSGAVLKKIPTMLNDKPSPSQIK